MARRESRRIAFLIYDGIQSLDLTGPLEVFAMANWTWRLEHPHDPPPYTTRIVAPRVGTVTTSSGLHLMAERSLSKVDRQVDTLFVTGGEVQELLHDRAVLGWLRRMAPRVRRLASVCSGSFLLAQAGLLAGRRATTHWSVIELLAGYSGIEVETDAIFVRDGNVYTSAGITAGIDLALALVEEDLGHDTALAVARRLVVFLKRPGGQSQFSGHLAAQVQGRGALNGVPEWILDNLPGDLSIEALARRAAMSPRNFARVFLRELGVTPAKFVEKARIDAARRLLEDSSLSLEEVAGGCGFTSGEQMRRTFQRHLRILPHDYRKRFQPQRPEPLAPLPGGRANQAPEGGSSHVRSKDPYPRRRPLPGLRAARRVRAAGNVR